MVSSTTLVSSTVDTVFTASLASSVITDGTGAGYHYFLFSCFELTAGSNDKLSVNHYGLKVPQSLKLKFIII
jgi:hypothetical protein